MILALCIGIVLIMVLKILYDKVVRYGKDQEFKKKTDKRSQFIQNTSPTSEQIEAARNVSGVSDLVDDFRYIFDDSTLTAQELKNKMKWNKQLVYNCSMSFVDAIEMLRLSKLGKLPQGYFQQEGVKVCEGTEMYKVVTRFYQRVIMNLNSAGVQADIYHKTKDGGLVVVNIKEFEVFA